VTRRADRHDRQRRHDRRDLGDHVVNSAPHPVAFWYSRNGTTQTRSVAAGANLTFNPPTAGVKWLTDAISWGIG
jgi:hypothetical protein